MTTLHVTWSWTLDNGNEQFGIISAKGAANIIVNHLHDKNTLVCFLLYPLLGQVQSGLIISNCKSRVGSNHF